MDNRMSAEVKSGASDERSGRRPYWTPQLVVLEDSLIQGSSGPGTDGGTGTNVGS